MCHNKLAALRKARENCFCQPDCPRCNGARKPSGSGNPRAEPTGELRIYGGLPNASNYGHPVLVLTNAAYLTGYCEARRNPAWVAFSVGSISIGSTAKRPSKFTTDTRTRSATHDDFTGSGFDRGHMAPNYA
ncbi:MAG: hypothetical protein FJ397_14240, partial [Verrucomicrobia bacterium]|nr:hypothetical protein [Verrucomicrobiota bacterium]